MKRRLVFSYVGVTAVVLVLLALPMGYLLQGVATDETKAQLNQQAAYLLERVTADLGDNIPLDEGALGNLLPPDTNARILLSGRDPIVLHDAPVGDTISATVSGDDGEIVTVSTSALPVQDRVRRPLVILSGLGLAGLLTTWLLAQSEARRLGQPLRELVEAAARFGSGDFSVTAPRSGIPEFDSLAVTLDASAARIDALVRAERRFNSDAGHQLRSALTGLRLRLEELALVDDPDAAEEAQAAIEQADRLSATIDDLLRLSRTGRAGVSTQFDLRTLVKNHAGDVLLVLRQMRRDIVIEPGPPLYILAAQGAVGQALDVLLWNAAMHGQGTVSLALASVDGWVQLEVCDQGSMSDEQLGQMFDERPRTSQHGIGLPLARRVIEAEGGSLELESRTPTTFRIRLPILAAS